MEKVSSKLVTDPQTRERFRVIDDGSIEGNELRGNEVTDPATLRKYHVPITALENGKLRGRRVVDKATGQVFYAPRVKDGGGLEIPAFDNTFVGKYQDAGSTYRIGRYNYITGAETVVISNGSDYEFLGYNFDEDYYYVYTETHPETETAGTWVCVFDATGQLINAIDCDIDFANSDVFSASAINVEAERVGLIEEDGGSQPGTGNPIHALKIYNNDLSELIAIIHGVKWAQDSYDHIFEVVTIPGGGGFSYTSPGNKCISACNKDGNILFEAIQSEIDPDDEGMNNIFEEQFLYPDAEYIHYAVNTGTTNVVDMRRIDFSGNSEVVRTFDLSVSSNAGPANIYIGAGQGIAPNTSNYKLFQLNDSSAGIELIPAPTPAAGFTGPGFPYYDPVGKKVYYATWETFSYVYDFETESVSQVAYEDESFHVPNQLLPDSFNEAKLIPYPGLKRL